MKKTLVFLTALLFSVGTLAKTVDQEGRVWLSATDIDTKKVIDDKQKTLEDFEIADAFKQFIIQDNNINKCLFPEVYRSNDRGEAVLDKWWSDTENNGRMKRAHYLKLKMRLAQRILPEPLINEYLDNRLSIESEQQYQHALSAYGKVITAHSVKECEDIGQYASDLIEEYDESNRKWRRDFGPKKVETEIDFNQAIDLVMKSVQKNKILPVKLECVSFSESNEDKDYYHIDIREKHNEKCGGDLQTAPRIMTYQVHKKTAELCTDSIEWAEKLKAKDPYNFECRTIK